MICKNCGHENEDGKKICENCGQEIEKSDQRDRRRQRRSQKADDEKIVIRKRENRKEKDMDLITVGMIFGGILIFAVAAIIFSYFANLGSKKEETPQKQVEEQVKDNEALYKQALEKADETIKDGDYLSALKILNAIPEASGDFYEKAQKQAKDIEKDVEVKINELIEANDEAKAKELADEYLKSNADAKNIKEISSKLKDTEENTDTEDKTEEETSEDKEETPKEEEKETEEDSNKSSKNYDKEYLRRTNSYGQNGNPAYTEVYSESDFLNKTIKIDANMGEIRTEPSLNSGVAGYVNRNETYKVGEVYNDGGRYWLNIGKGWISSKLVTGEFRD